MNISLRDGTKIAGWNHAINISDASLKTYQEANLRELYDNEIILDIESKSQAKETKRELNSEGLFYTEWDTSSRGRHFHLLYKGLEALQEKERLLYRSRIISKYKADPAKKNGFIAMEHRPHLKTGAYKTLVSEKKGVNSLDLDLVSSIKQRIAKTEYHFTGKKFDNSNLDELMRELKVTDLWNKWCMSKKGNRWDTPFAVSSSKACVSISDSKGVWYDFHTCQGGTIFTAVQMKHSCSFPEAIKRIKEGDY